jgi:hypothetical protein
MKRTPIRRKTAPDRLDAAERLHVLNRDRECIIAILTREGDISPTGTEAVCRNQWGEPILTFTLDNLTYEHVKPAPAMSLRAPSNRRWGVAACHHHNTNGATSKYRAAIREHLTMLELRGLL